MNTRAIYLYHLYIARAVIFFSCVCALCALLYCALLLETVAHAARQNSTQHQIATLSHEVALLESKYLIATKALSPTLAKDMGFAPPVSVSEVYTQTQTLTLNTR